MHTTHQKIFEQVSIYAPNLKMSEYLSMLDAAISNIEFVEVYPVAQTLITVTNTALPTPITPDYVAVKRVYATTATTASEIPTAINSVIKQYTVEQGAIWIHSPGNYVVEYYYRPEITDENSDPMITDSFVQSIVEHILYQDSIKLDINKAALFLQNSVSHARQAHLKETKKHKNPILKPLF